MKSQLIIDTLEELVENLERDIKYHKECLVAQKEYLANANPKEENIEQIKKTIAHLEKDIDEDRKEKREVKKVLKNYLKGE